MCCAPVGAHTIAVHRTDTPLLYDLSLDQLRGYRPERREPGDFDAFWEATLEAARQFPLSATFRPVNYGLSLVRTYDVMFAGFGGDPIRGWLLLPAEDPSMRAQSIVAALLVLSPGAARATEFHVAPQGLSTGDGGPGAPWDLATALAHPAAVQPGDTILLHGGQVHLVVGTPGGSTIITTVFQTIVDIEDYGLTPAEALDAPRFHHQLLPPDLVTMSPARPLPPPVIEALIRRGYRVEPHPWEIGDAQVILRRGRGYVAASDPRGRGVSRVTITKATN